MSVAKNTVSGPFPACLMQGVELVFRFSAQEATIIGRDDGKLSQKNHLNHHDKIL